MSQDLSYYSSPREDVLRFISRPVNRALDIGCGTGATLSLLKDKGLITWAGGIEVTPKAAAVARDTLDKVWQGNVETLDLGTKIEPGSIDLILLMDVLEHLVDPWALMKRLTPWLGDDGIVIANIPNVRNKTIVKQLVFHGRWDYAPSGLMDETHLRWFTRSTMQELMECGGLTVTDVDPIPSLKPWKNKWIYTKLSGGFLEDFWASSFMMRAKKTDQKR